MNDEVPDQLYIDMGKLNALYEELMWGNEDILEFVADYENNRIIVKNKTLEDKWRITKSCLLYTSPSPRDNRVSRMPSSA